MLLCINIVLPRHTWDTHGHAHVQGEVGTWHGSACAYNASLGHHMEGARLEDVPRHAPRVFVCAKWMQHPWPVWLSRTCSGPQVHMTRLQPLRMLINAPC